MDDAALQILFFFILWPVLITPSPAMITPLPENKFPSRLTPRLPNVILRNPPLFFNFIYSSLKDIVYQDARIFERLNYFHDVSLF